MDNLNAITYADDWKQAYTPVYKEVTKNQDSENTEISKVKTKHKKSYLLTVQLIMCLIILLSALVLKVFGGDLYKSIRGWYYENLNNEIIMTEDFYSFDLDEIFNNEAKNQ